MSIAEIQMEIFIIWYSLNKEIDENIINKKMTEISELRKLQNEIVKQKRMKN